MAVVLAGAAAATAVSPAVAGSRPVPLAGPAAAVSEIAPPGVNDWSCRPGHKHPRPVVLLHDTLTTMAIDWPVLGPMLDREGYCVFALDYGGPLAGTVGGLGPIEESATELAHFVDHVLRVTGARQVDIVGHSLGGGLVPRYYIKFRGGAHKVHTLVSLAATNHGSTLSGINTLLAHAPGGRLVTWAMCPSCAQEIPGAPLLHKLNHDGGTDPRVRYVNIATRYDMVSTPYTVSFLDGPNVDNILLQDVCPMNTSDHFTIVYDRDALELVLNALDPHRAWYRPVCGHHALARPGPHRAAGR
jgi:triacylglycerol esterase/lipase EstA (alpha/beta hydrolase family)